MTLQVNPVRIRIQGLDDQKNEEKNTAEDLIKIFFWSKLAIYLSLGIIKERPSYRRSLRPSKENIQPFKWNFVTFLFFLWVIFALLDPDPIRMRIRTFKLQIRHPIRHEIWLRILDFKMPAKNKYFVHISFFYIITDCRYIYISQDNVSYHNTSRTGKIKDFQNIFLVEEIRSGSVQKITDPGPEH